MITWNFFTFGIPAWAESSEIFNSFPNCVKGYLVLFAFCLLELVDNRLASRSRVHSPTASSFNAGGNRLGAVSCPVFFGTFFFYYSSFFLAWAISTTRMMMMMQPDDDERKENSTYWGAGKWIFGFKSAISHLFEFCQLVRPSRERQECDSTLVPLASAGTMRFLHPLLPLNDNNNKQPQEIKLKKKIHLSVAGFLATKKKTTVWQIPSNQKPVDVLDVDLSLSLFSLSIGEHKTANGNRKKRVVTWGNSLCWPCQSVRGRELIESGYRAGGPDGSFFSIRTLLFSFFLYIISVSLLLMRPVSIRWVRVLDSRHAALEPAKPERSWWKQEKSSS